MSSEVKSTQFTRHDISILIINMLERFDMSLYSFLAPVMAPFFFPHHDATSQLIYMYGISAVSVIARPVGTLLFCTLARWHGPVYALVCSAYGVMCATIGVACMPSYEIIGACAPALLVVLRLCKGTCAAGESSIATMYIMENKQYEHAFRASYWYQSSSMVGIVCASAVATLVIGLGAHAWRFCFLCGGCIGLVAYYMRTHGNHSTLGAHIMQIDSEESGSSLWVYMKMVFHMVREHKNNIMRVALAYSFSHATYAVPFIFLNVIVPYITSITLETMMMFNTILLLCDMMVIPVIGYFCERFHSTHVMMYASGVLAVTMIPLFYFLPHASFAYVMCMRMWIVLWGVIFLCPLNIWCKELFQGADQYTLVGLGNLIATSTIAHMMTPLCLWLWHMTGTILAPAFYIALLMTATSYAVYTSSLYVQQVSAQEQ